MTEQQDAPAGGEGRVLNIPNQITAVRLALAIVLFVLIPLDYFFAAMFVFLAAAGTDWVDGYWARKYDQVTQLGRIFDPFVDKILICGTFIYLAAEPRSGIAAWMAVLIVGRELLVKVLRSFLETRGADFSAKMPGKLKMVLQCAAAAASLLALSTTGVVPSWLATALAVSVWGAIALTVYSGIIYIIVAAKLLRG